MMIDLMGDKGGIREGSSPKCWEMTPHSAKVPRLRGHCLPLPFLLNVRP
jgi:hypothetical protein